MTAPGRNAPPAQAAAHYLGLAPDEVAKDLDRMAEQPADTELEARRKFLECLKIPHFSRRLKDKEDRAALAGDLLSHVQVWCEDRGESAVPASTAIRRTLTRRPGYCAPVADQPSAARARSIAHSTRPMLPPWRSCPWC